MLLFVSTKGHFLYRQQPSFAYATINLFPGTHAHTYWYRPVSIAIGNDTIYTEFNSFFRYVLVCYHSRKGTTV